MSESASAGLPLEGIRILELGAAIVLPAWSALVPKTFMLSASSSAAAPPSRPPTLANITAVFAAPPRASSTLTPALARLRN